MPQAVQEDYQLDGVRNTELLRLEPVHDTVLAHLR